MICRGVAQGERPGARTWLGLLLAAIWRSALMLVAGAVWAAFSLQAKRATDPLTADARASFWSLPLAPLLGESLDLRLVSSGALVLGGVALALTARTYRSTVAMSAGR
jgi:hypothetical protein